MKKTILFLICLLLIPLSAYAFSAAIQACIAAGGATAGCTWAGSAAIDFDHIGDTGDGALEGPYIAAKVSLTGTRTVTGYKISITTYTGPHDWIVSLYTNNVAGCSGNDCPGTEITGTSKTVSDSTYSYHSVDVTLDTPKTGLSGTVWIVVQNADVDWSRLQTVTTGALWYCNGATPQTGCNFGKNIMITLMGCAE